MDFESALRMEISSVEGLKNKIFPINAPESTPAPYVTYLMSLINPIQTLNNVLDIYTGSYEINILCNSYSSLKTFGKKVENKLKSMQQRVIGVDGPFLQECTVEGINTVYENQIGLYRMIIDIKITYKEE